MDHLRLPKDDKDGGPPENCSQCYKSAGQICVLSKVTGAYRRRRNVHMLET